MKDTSGTGTRIDERGELTSDLKRYIDDRIREYVAPIAGKVDRTQELLLKKTRIINVLELKMTSAINEKRRGHAQKEPSDTTHEALAGERLEQVFDGLVEKWNDETINLSSMQRITANSAYLSIIGLGPRAIPLILDLLRREPDWWFCALRAITRVDPVTEQMRGDLSAMTNAWLDWGRDHGYV